MIRYDIGQLFQVAFGENLPVYLAHTHREGSNPIYNYGSLEVLEEYQEEMGEIPHSWLNTPIVFSAFLEGSEGKYWRYKLNGQLEQVQMSTMMFPEATMFSFRRAKNITRTNVLGSNGTVKEIYGFDDWQIDVRGLCLTTPQQTAMQQLEQLLEWEKIADSIRVKGTLFNKLSIYRVAISEMSWNVVQGKPEAIAYTMQLISDDPMELQLTNTI